MWLWRTTDWPFPNPICTPLSPLALGYVHIVTCLEHNNESRVEILNENALGLFSPATSLDLADSGTYRHTSDCHTLHNKTTQTYGTPGCGLITNYKYQNPASIALP